MNKNFFKKMKKTLDKPISLWYNKDRKKERGTKKWKRKLTAINSKKS